MLASAGAKPSESKKENEEPTNFKSGGALPSVADAPSSKKASVFDFPKLGGGAQGNAEKDLASRAHKMFDDNLDDFDDNDNDKRAELDFEQGSDDEEGSGDFNANELLNLTDY